MINNSEDDFNTSDIKTFQFKRFSNCRYKNSEKVSLLSEFFTR